MTGCLQAALLKMSKALPSDAEVALFQTADDDPVTPVASLVSLCIDVISQHEEAIFPDELLNGTVGPSENNTGSSHDNSQTHGDCECAGALSISWLPLAVRESLLAQLLIKCAGARTAMRPKLFGLFALPDLQELRIPHSTCVPKRLFVNALDTCTRLRLLDLSWVSYVDDELVHTITDRCSLLEQLHVAGCRQITKQSIVYAIEHLKELKSLDVSSCFKVVWDEQCATVKPAGRNLVSLNISGVKITETDRPLRAFSHQITRLEVSAVNHAHLFVVLGLGSAMFEQLQYLDISGNVITELSPELCSLSQLTALVANGNRITQVPDCVASLQQLQTLRMRVNALRRVSPMIGGCVSLTDVDFSYNSLTELPFELLHLPALHTLNCDYNSIKGRYESAYGRIKNFTMWFNF